MTDDKHWKRAARELAAREGISYTAALRWLGEGRREREREGQGRLPGLVPTASLVCPEGCDGSMHPSAVCRAWRPKDAKGARREVQQLATLPSGRALKLAQRYEVDSRDGRDDAWVLALVYAMLTDQRPELRPDRAALRAAVEADDLNAVDAAMEPLDRAAARLLTKVPTQWWNEVQGQLDDYADDVEADDRKPRTWQEIEDRYAVGRLVEQWRTAWDPVRNGNGYNYAPPVLWPIPKGWLDELLVARHGGTLGRVRLPGGRPGTVYAAEWGEDGPPVAYRARELVPGTHENVGRLVPSYAQANDLRILAGDCQPWSEYTGPLIDIKGRLIEG
ncbi:hypothetical protein ACWD3J_17075 [Streptomyces sp. NPDC002755]